MLYFYRNLLMGEQV